jgi:single-stranded-DNA-specific exonuclease
MAAGCTLEAEGFARFEAAFGAVAGELLDASTLQRTVWVDGPLPAEAFGPEVVRRLDDVVWGQAFEPPLFCDEVDVLSQREVGTGHLKLAVRHHGTTRDAIWFGRREPLPGRVRLAYRLQLDAWNGQERVQMVVEAAEAA